jgi:hypothetical protein
MTGAPTMDEKACCSGCGKNTKNYINNYNPALAINQKTYWEAVENGMALYCAVCDRTFCLDCMKSYAKVDDIDIPNIKTAMAEYAKKNLENGNLKFFLLSCPSCGTNLGDLHSKDQQVLINVLDEKNVSLDDLSESMKNLFILINRLRAKNLVVDRTKTLEEMLQSLTEKLLIPQFGLEIQRYFQEGKVNDAKQYANRAALWISLMSKKGKMVEGISTAYQILKRVKKSMANL